MSTVNFIITAIRFPRRKKFLNEKEESQQKKLKKKKSATVHVEEIFIQQNKETIKLCLSGHIKIK